MLSEAFVTTWGELLLILPIESFFIRINISLINVDIATAIVYTTTIPVIVHFTNNLLQKKTLKNQIPKNQGHTTKKQIPDKFWKVLVNCYFETRLSMLTCIYLLDILIPGIEQDLIPGLSRETLIILIIFSLIAYIIHNKLSTPSKSSKEHDKSRMKQWFTMPLEMTVPSFWRILLSGPIAIISGIITAILGSVLTMFISFSILILFEILLYWFELTSKRNKALTMPKDPKDKFQGTEAYRCLKISLDMAKERGDKEQESKVYLSLGHGYKQNNQFQLAIENYGKALEFAKEKEDKLQETEAHLGLGSAYTLDNDFETAIKCYMEVLRIADEGEDKYRKTEALLGSGDAYQSKACIQLAIEHFEKALENAKTKEAKRQQTKAYLRLGNIFKTTDIQTAIPYYEKALKIEREEGDKEQETNARLGLGTQDHKLDINEEPKSANALADEQPGITIETDKNEESKSTNALADEEPDLFEDSEDEEPTFFEKTFLDDEYNIAEEVHEKFKSFSWLRGAYGVTGPNKKIHQPHLYVTVGNGTNESDVLADIKAAFECEPNEYFELLHEPKRKLKFTHLLRPSAGGGIVAATKDNRRRSSGTLTMFCSENDNHYALTCFHVACGTHDEQDYNETFKGQGLLKIRNSIDGYREHAKTLEYHFYERKDDKTDESKKKRNHADNIVLGKFSNCSFHSESDIMSIEVREGAEIDCKVKEIELPNWKRIRHELYKRVVGKTENVLVEKVGFATNKTVGRIVKWNHSYSPHENELLFKNAIVIEAISENFLKSGDSGALIHFFDSKGRKQAFAYGVSEVDKLNPQGTSTDEDSKAGTSSEDTNQKDSAFSVGEATNSKERVSASGKRWETKDASVDDSDDDFFKFLKTGENGPFHIGLMLDTALKNLKLSQAGCFKKCAGVKSESGKANTPK